MRTILVTGADGQLGREFASLNAPEGFQVVFASRQDLDISRNEMLRDMFEKYEVAYCINTAAYTAVDKAESDRDAAFKINADGAALLAKICNEKACPLFHFSTDYVYHSRQNSPIKESDDTFAVGAYAQSKLEGDKLILQYHPVSFVIRTSWLYSQYGNNFVKTMLRLGAERHSVKVVYDQVGSPTYAKDLAQSVYNIIGQLEKDPEKKKSLAGIYHYSNEGVCSWYDLAHSIFEISKLSCSAIPIPSSEYPVAASRPFYSVLDKSKIKSTFGLQIPHWRDSLKECLNAIIDLNS